MSRIIIGIQLIFVGFVLLAIQTQIRRCCRRKCGHNYSAAGCGRRRLWALAFGGVWLSQVALLLLLRPRTLATQADYRHISCYLLFSANSRFEFSLGRAEDTDQQLYVPTNNYIPPRCPRRVCSDGWAEGPFLLPPMTPITTHRHRRICFNMCVLYLKRPRPRPSPSPIQIMQMARLRRRCQSQTISRTRIRNCNRSGRKIPRRDARS